MIKEVLELAENADRITLQVMPRNDGSDKVAIVFATDLITHPISFVSKIDEADQVLKEKMYESPSQYLRKILKNEAEDNT
jgi:hypothetical protein